jgi:hypothetical protein
MYDELREFARRQDVAGFIEGYLSETLTEERVRGVHVGIDRFWFECWLAEWAQRNSPCQWLGTRVDVRWLRTFRNVFNVDFDFRPPNWNRHCKTRGYPEGGNPIYIKFILREPLTETKEFLRRDWQGYPILYEYRPVCRALSIISTLLGKGQLTAGSSIGLSSPSPAGTAGGFLRDTAASKDYLVSCAHVMRKVGDDVYYPSPNEWGLPTKIGEVRLSLLPGAKGPNMKCNRVAAPSAPTLDLAVAELDSSLSLNPEIPKVGPVDHVNSISNISQGDYVVFVGKTSGLVEAELGSLCIWHEIEIDNQPYCFSDLFEMTHRRPFYLNTNLAEGGDSGAWVVNITNNIVGWDGMLIGGDGAQAYGCFSENIMDGWDNNFPGQQLTLIP